jgi:uncharacterized membrane protein
MQELLFIIGVGLALIVSGICIWIFLLFIYRLIMGILDPKELRPDSTPKP